MIRRAIIAIATVAAIAAAIFSLTHTPIYGPCTITTDGKVCPLIGYK